MNDTAVEFNNVSKRYFIGEHSIRTLRDDLSRWMVRLLNKSADSPKELWALKEVSFQIKKGESVGLIGANGSGKTTIFKLISRISLPTQGKVKVNGKAGSLIDLNAGFHPELTGLENIYLNAAIRGMRRRDIKNKLEEILDFAGIERFKDTPVKHYSAGMKVRLGFAVAVSCPFDILLVDEVLAVGDADFQKKCLDRIAELQKEGKTIFFVSHDMDKVRQVCPRVIRLSQGKTISDGGLNVTPAIC